jgi:uncharacterized membrane protein YobD (UPF0266 family)
MESKILKTLGVAAALIIILTICFNYFSKSSSTIGQSLLVATMLLSLYTAYKLIRNIITKK